jgi:hypothetical protein
MGLIRKAEVKDLPAIRKIADSYEAFKPMWYREPWFSCKNGDFSKAQALFGENPIGPLFYVAQEGNQIRGYAYGYDRRGIEAIINQEKVQPSIGSGLVCAGANDNVELGETPMFRMLLDIEPNDFIYIDQLGVEGLIGQNGEHKSSYARTAVELQERYCAISQKNHVPLYASFCVSPWRNERSIRIAKKLGWRKFGGIQVLEGNCFWDIYSKSP